MEINLLSNEELAAIRELTEEYRRKIPVVLLTHMEAARLIGVTPNTIRGYIKQGRLTKRTIGSVTGILLRDVLDFKGKKNPA